MMSALDRYLEFTADEPEADPIERLRFFLSLSLSGQDWIDVEPFIDAVTSEREQLAAKAGEVMRDRAQDGVGNSLSRNYLTSYEEGCEDMKDSMRDLLSSLPQITLEDIQK